MRSSKPDPLRKTVRRCSGGMPRSLTWTHKQTPVRLGTMHLLKEPVLAGHPLGSLRGLSCLGGLEPPEEATGPAAVAPAGLRKSGVSGYPGLTPRAPYRSLLRRLEHAAAVTCLDDRDSSRGAADTRGSATNTRGNPVPTEEEPRTREETPYSPRKGRVHARKSRTHRGRATNTRGNPVLNEEESRTREETPRTRWGTPPQSCTHRERASVGPVATNRS
jgi:hypothetical protein